MAIAAIAAAVSLVGPAPAQTPEHVTTQSYAPGGFGAWTDVVAVDDYLLWYNANTGAGAIGVIEGGGTAHKTVRSYPPGAFAKGWTRVIAVPSNAGTKVLWYNASTGAGAIGHIEDSPSGPAHVTDKSYAPGSFGLGWVLVAATQGGNLIWYKRDGSAALGHIGEK